MESDERPTRSRYPEPVEDQLTYDMFLDGAKEAINQLLWKWLPGDTSLRHAESIACHIHSVLDGEWEDYERKEKERLHA